MGRSEPADLADATTNELLAMLEVMFLVAVADRNFSPEERRNFLEHAQSLSGGKFDSSMLVRLVGSWEKRDLKNVDERLVELSRDFPDESSRRIAYGLACRVVQSDGLAAAEAAVLAKVAAALGLDGEEEEDIARSVKMSSFPPGA